MMRTVSGSNIGPDLGKDWVNPSRDVYKTRADVVKLIQQAVADGADLINNRATRGWTKPRNSGSGTGWSTILTPG